MYKVLLVDDEDIEREAMAAIIPWEKVNMELVDMAWNGIEGLEKIRQYEPDIVITDIKMPVMDGIQLIKKAQELFANMAFVVLSGYGDYEYTSQAMELGIRHYILKPCDEQKIVEVLTNVKNELASREEKRKSEHEMQKNLHRMLPHLKEQILYELLMKKELSLADQSLLRNFTEHLEDDFVLLSVRSQMEFDQLDRFTLTNILTELLGEDCIYASTVFQKEVVYLIPARLQEKMRPFIERTHSEYARYKDAHLRSALSGRGKIEDSYVLYRQIQELFYFGELNKHFDFLEAGIYKETTGAIPLKVDYNGIKNAGSYQELLFELYSSFAVLELEQIPEGQIWEIFNFSLKVMFHDEAEPLGAWEDSYQILEQMVERCAQELNLQLPQTKDGERLKIILHAVYRNIKNTDLTLQYLAAEVLFINEDYFGRFFLKSMHEKYSSFLVRVRILLAQRLLLYFPDMKISELAEQIGFPADGQYLSKVFKKQTNMLVSDYRKTLFNSSV